MCFDLIILGHCSGCPGPWVAFLGAASTLSGRDKKSDPEGLCASIQFMEPQPSDGCRCVCVCVGALSRVCSLMMVNLCHKIDYFCAFRISLFEEV